ncbi:MULTISPECIES: hypothetical protein [Streptomyces]|nr:hypothetical protein [Streptomyces ruber]
MPASPAGIADRTTLRGGYKAARTDLLDQAPGTRVGGVRAY